MTVVYDYRKSIVDVWEGGTISETVPFNAGSYKFPEEVVILLNFKKGKLSLQEAYHLLKYDPSLYFIEEEDL